MANEGRVIYTEPGKMTFKEADKDGTIIRVIDTPEEMEVHVRQPKNEREADELLAGVASAMAQIAMMISSANGQPSGAFIRIATNKALKALGSADKKGVEAFFDAPVFLDLSEEPR